VVASADRKWGRVAVLNYPERPGIAGIFQAAARGEPSAAALLLPLVYEELRHLARARIARLGRDQTLTPTELVHETYLRLAGRSRFDGRRHFFFAASRAMRDYLVERARRKASLKRGGGYRLVPADDLAAIATPREDLLDLERALARLERENSAAARVVALSYFGGLTHPEIAEVLGLSLATVERRWVYCRAWLRRELRSSAAQPPGKGRRVPAS
jgi:RNA polymerase sigma factor (TIGR02999 family)